MKNLIIFFSILLFISNSAYAVEAKVIMIKGTATKLLPHKMNPEPVKMGDILPKDTSIVTQKGSFVKIEFSNTKTTMILGPDSKINIEGVKKSDATVVSHLIGALRTKVNQKTEKEKVFIKTKTASMGVRGTELLTVVNQENQATSLVTFEGKVAMVKVDKHEAPVVNEEQLGKKFEAEEKVTEVRKGRAASAYDQVEEVTPPQKVQPQQLVALKENETLLQEKKEAAKPVELTPDQEKELYAPDTAEEAKNPQKMGVVDLKSAIFVPTNDKGEVVGEIDANGNYTPEKGLKLDPLVGFVPVDVKNEDAVAMATQMNQAIAFKPKEEHAKAYQEKVNTVLATEEVSRHDFYAGIGLGIYSQRIFELTSNDSGDATYYTNPVIRVRLGWDWQFNSSFKLLTAITLEGIEYNQGDSSDGNDTDLNGQDDRGKMLFETGLSTKINSRFWLNLKLGQRKELYLVGGLNENSNFVAIPREVSSFQLTIEPQYLIGDYSKISYYLFPRIIFIEASGNDYIATTENREIGFKLQRKNKNSNSFYEANLTRVTALRDGSEFSTTISGISLDWIYVF